MAKKSLTIEEIKNRKSEVEKDILKMLRDFEKETETMISYVSTQIDRGDDSWDIEKSGKPGKKRKSKGLLDFTLELNLENDVRSID